MDLASALLWTALHVLGLQHPRISESVTVVGTASPIASPSAVTTLGRRELEAAPAFTLDDVLRSVPGFSLFRRSSSRVANPTTQGATLRGLAASGASRALVLADGVALNDPFGGWVYWNRVPAAAIEQVSVSRGAAGDLHGADALAGVVSIRTSVMGGRLLVDGGSHSTSRVSAFGSSDGDFGFVTGAVEAATTDGYVMVAPESRGSIDEPAGSRHVSAYGTFAVPASGVSLSAAHFRESRRNGTPLQRNSTRISSIASSLSGSAGLNAGWAARANASTQQYEQTFSAVFSSRTAERLTSSQDVGATAYEAEGEYWWQGSHGLEISSQLHVKRVGADLIATSYAPNGAPMADDETNATQWNIGAGARAAYRHSHVNVGAAARVERSRSRSTRDVVVTPKAWITARLTNRTNLTAAFQSGFRAPTINELYRPFRVGNVLTDANPALHAERVQGLEAGIVWNRRGLTARALGFWSRVNDAIVNVTLSATNDLILRQRRNAARIRAAGAELELEARLGRQLTLTASSSYTDSLFVRGPLDGLSVPQVPRWQHSAGARFAAGRVRASAEWRYIGAQFDDDRNAFELDRSSITDARVGWIVTRRVEIFGAVENVLAEAQDVGRTPLRTLGLPRTTRVGARVTF